MSIKAVVCYLDYRLKANEEKTLYRVFVAENLATLSAGAKYKERMNYTEYRNKLWGITPRKDTRTGQEIIADTLAKHGIAVKQRVDK